MCQQSIRWALEQKLRLFSLSSGWRSWVCVCVCGVEGVGGDSRALAAHSLDVTYCIGSVCGR